MGFQTKIILTFISMFSCVSVMTSGIVAILYQNNFQVNNNETIVMNAVVGDLYGYRFGGGYYDIWDGTAENMKPVLLYHQGEPVSESDLNMYQQNVGFGTAEKKIEYILYYEIGSMSEVTTWITLENFGVKDKQTNSASEAYVDRYQYLTQGLDEEPSQEDWEIAKDITETLIIDSKTRCIWLRAVVQPRTATYQSADFLAPCTWTFSFNFNSQGA